ncbi:adaptor protein MecA [Heyndrickxia oleronia]|uniref:Adapter protein MecA n=1 Tax=Heyndrickxia oleronia TaxID=38875 RepID=A0A8E2LD09_9BACI|nr:adaptor protein MecA [Heyndrickxia oleronia]OOP64694.1 adaptor protein MecA [Heyndrickxia oleronia]
MEIERINENTVKFYISYVDIEERGFNREEIWYDRERSEELFWEMMDEIHHEEEFVPEGPLWIQVQALDKGLEVLVTKAQLSNDGQRFELPISEEKLKDLPINDRIEEFLDEHFQSKQFLDDNDTLEFMLGFKEFEDVISLSKRTELDELQTKLFSFKNKYYLYVEFPDDLFEEEDIDNLLSILLEYGDESSLTVHRLQEYGNLISDENVFATINKYFH